MADFSASRAGRNVRFSLIGHVVSFGLVEGLEANSTSQYVQWALKNRVLLRKQVTTTRESEENYVIYITDDVTERARLVYDMTSSYYDVIKMKVKVKKTSHFRQ